LGSANVPGNWNILEGVCQTSGEDAGVQTSRNDHAWNGVLLLQDRCDYHCVIRESSAEVSDTNIVSTLSIGFLAFFPAITKTRQTTPRSMDVTTLNNHPVHSAR
jgi:hypothetical protein